MPDQSDFTPDAAGAGGRDEAVEAAAFTHALHRAADTFPPADGLAMVTAGYARGRTLRRRRTAVVTAAAAVLALAGTGGVLATTSGHGAAGVNSGVTAASGASHGAATAGAHAVDTAAGARPVSAQQMEDLLVSMLPPGTVSGRDGRGTDDELPPYAHVVFDDGHGASAIEVGVETDGATAPGCDSVPTGDSCTQTHVDGGTLTVLKTWEYPDHRTDTKDWLAEFQGKDGSLVTVSEWNAPAEKGAPVTRPEPPLSAGRLAAIATNPAWHRVAAAERAGTAKDPARRSSSNGRREGAADSALIV
ncbi:hypothetical protein [Actinacidiphila acidipaludis]|uniref:Uncharacterized protein n=1 Tax=Actinacidiphila acidipaludis TaxID=2873382 RepID=A0ABS7QGH8_9ACTN|nr:hypothetical protein [Streptomyces acidipaludis]MBY8882276.1 hypothetical protein [Streptomyces acidipaludis]